MKKIAIMDTSVMSFNLGDQIIMESCRQGLSPLLQDAFVVNMPTHSPLFHWYEFSLRKKDIFTLSLRAFDLKFVCGTNLLEKNMRKRKNSWNLHLSDSRYINDFILVGVGTDGLSKIQNEYTRKLYKSILSQNYIHSTRDEKTKEFLEAIGLKAINTGCASLWPLTEEHCRNIPTHKAETVVFTLTDYCKDLKLDTKLIRILIESYAQVYYWPQGFFDLNYFNQLTTDSQKKRIKLIEPSLKGYEAFLSSNSCDYIGTRLHAGIKAMQKGKRSIILTVDNRALDMSERFSLNCVERSKVALLESYINQKISTQVHVDYDAVKKFLIQFMEAQRRPF